MNKITLIWFLVMITLLFLAGGGATFFFWIHRKVKDADKD